MQTCKLRVSHFRFPRFLCGSILWLIASVAHALMPQTIALNTTLLDLPTNSMPFVVSAISDSSLPVSFSSHTQSVCTTGTNNGMNFITVTLVANAVGQCTLVVVQTGDATYSAAVSVVRSFNVGPMSLIGFAGVSMIATGADHTCALTTAGGRNVLGLEFQWPIGGQHLYSKGFRRTIFN